MKTKKVGKNYELLFVKKEEIVQYARELPELSIVPEDVQNRNILKPDAHYYFYLITQCKQPTDIPEYKGSVTVSLENKITGVFDFSDLPQLPIQDVIKVLDRITIMCQERDFPNLRFKHGGNSTYIAAAKKLGYNVKKNTMVAEIESTEDSVTTMAALLA